MATGNFAIGDIFYATSAKTIARLHPSGIQFSLLALAGSSGDAPSWITTLNGNYFGNQSANKVFASGTVPGSSAPAFRLLVAADIPTLTLSKISDAGTAASHATTDFDAAGAAAAAVVTAEAYADAGLAGKVSILDARLNGTQSFFAAALSANVTSNQWLLGNGTTGVRATAAGTIDEIVCQAQIALAVLTSVVFKIWNLTTNQSVSVTMVAGDTYKRTTSGGLVVSVGDEIAIDADTVTGVPAAGIFNITAVKRP